MMLLMEKKKKKEGGGDCGERKSHSLSLSPRAKTVPSSFSIRKADAIFFYLLREKNGQSSIWLFSPPPDSSFSTLLARRKGQTHMEKIMNGANLCLVLLRKRR